MQLSFYLTTCGHVKVVGNQDRAMPTLTDYKIPVGPAGGIQMTAEMTGRGGRGPTVPPHRSPSPLSDTSLSIPKEYKRVTLTLTPTKIEPIDLPKSHSEKS